MQNEELLTVRDILDDDYGCEELPLGAEPMVTVSEIQGITGYCLARPPVTYHIRFCSR